MERERERERERRKESHENAPRRRGKVRRGGAAVGPFTGTQNTYRGDKTGSSRSNGEGTNGKRNITRKELKVKR
jgi:hypothetical protein